MYEVNQTLQANELLDVFQKAYHYRYKVPYTLSYNGADMTILKDLVRNEGFERAAKIVVKYLSINDLFYVKMAHSLSYLIRALPQVNVAVGSQIKQVEQVNHGIRVKFWSYCDTPGCMQVWEHECNSNDVPRVSRYCPKCTF